MRYLFMSIKVKNILLITLKRVISFFLFSLPKDHRVVSTIDQLVN